VDTLELIRSGKGKIPRPPSELVKEISNLAGWLASSSLTMSETAKDIGDYVKVYANVRGVYLVKSLQPLAAQASDQRRLESKSSSAFINLTTWLVHFLNAERNFAEIVFSPKNVQSIESSLDGALSSPLDLFLETGNTLLAQIKRSNGRSDFSLVFLLFDVLEFWSAKREELGTALDVRKVFRITH
jgi:hypothetical protein